MAQQINSDYILNSNDITDHIKVFAGPGAGKTYFLVQNIKNLVITSPLIVNSTSRKILCITYTNAAVNEIQNRLDRYNKNVEICTIHKFIIEHIIMPFQDDLKEIMSMDFGLTINRKAKISSQIEGLSILHGYEKVDIERYVNAETTENDIIDYSKSRISKIEIDIDKYAKNNIRILKQDGIASNHVKPLKQFMWSVIGKLTHNEILYFGYRILQENSTALYTLRVKFPYLFVDEFQDTNPVQTLLLKLVGACHSKIIVIGDVAQSIYSFQGATPTEFLTFSKIGNSNIKEFVIDGNRRSTNNIVQLCNFIRKSDVTVIQNSHKIYSGEGEKQEFELIPVKFLLGSSESIMNIIDSVLKTDGVVLTRQWSSAFEYIQGISSNQKKILRAVYNTYYPTSIDIRKDIIEHSYVTWVRVFKFIMILYEAKQTGAFSEVMSALELYFDVKKIKRNNIITSKDIILITVLLEEIFEDIHDGMLIMTIIQRFNDKTNSCIELKNVWKKFGNSDFELKCISEYDKPAFVKNINEIEWKTAYKLFTEVFSDNSKYMTVHQAKGLEWDKVVVGVKPTRNDHADLSVFWNNPQILSETSTDEFARIYYVACSRARKELYVHIEDASLESIIRSKLTAYKEQFGINISFEFLT